MLNDTTVRSRRLLDMARDQPCVSCGADDGTIVAAHSNLLEHGKGAGHKSHDCMSAWLCYRCHSEYDQGKTMTKDQKRDFILTMICRTNIRLWQLEMIGCK
jgi:ferredoxin